ncbi:MAG: GNAT family N-acetyltransferase, partial [Flavobacteriaceae bacterium]|nr:GNAT family N-acetyltransferase [Eudoraea sp.]NNJ38400.1 GNAT family N-acetyltransferase [Flavobacteriaceae bacterium]
IEAERPFDPTIRQPPVKYYDLKALLLDEHVGVFVAEYNGMLVSSGYGMARKARSYLDHEEYAYLGFMYTLPEYRGKGINQRILRALQDWAKSMGLIELRLTVYEDNLPAVKAYEKAGFRKHIIEMRLREN